MSVANGDVLCFLYLHRKRWAEWIISCFVGLHSCLAENTLL